MTKIGQKTGMLNISKKVQVVAITKALLPEYLKKNKVIVTLINTIAA